MPQKPFQSVTKAYVRRFGPGEEPEHGTFKPGDFILTHGNTFFSKLIRFGQHIRFRGQDSKYDWWNHAAMIISEDGDIIEALGAGVCRSKLSKYKPTEFHIISIDQIVAPDDRNQAVKFAEWCDGMPYGWVTIISIAISLLTGGKFNFGFDGQAICSGLVARALERTNAIFNRSPSHIMPADLAKYFEVERPPTGTCKGEVPKVHLS